jgi:hypothetical protein
VVRKCTHGNPSEWLSHPNVHKVNSLPFLSRGRRARWNRDIGTPPQIESPTHNLSSKTILK